MFDFLANILGKIGSALAAVFVAVGLIATPTPAPEVEQEAVIDFGEASVMDSTEEGTMEKDEDDEIAAEIEKLKMQLEAEQEKREALEAKLSAPPPPLAPVVVPPPAPVVVAPLPPPRPQK